MSYAQPKQYFAVNQRTISNADAIEWEELPSFADSLAQRLIRRTSKPVRVNDLTFMSASAVAAPWDATMPAAFDTAPASEPSHELLAGLTTREVTDPGVFQHFFGINA